MGTSATSILKPEAGAPDSDGPAPNYRMIELLFFAYRDFVGDADARLTDYGFGRAHHRVLHFVDRNPGIRVTDLLDILNITKQSLARVLKQLVEDGFVEQSEGAADRRQRLLTTTPKGHRLALDLALLQTRRIDRALAACPPGAEAEALAFLGHMIDASARPDIRRLLAADPQKG